MPADQLNIRIAVDSSALQSGMAQATAAVDSASQRMAASLKSAGLSATDAASAMRNLGFSTEEVSTALQSVNLGLNESSVAGEQMARSVNNARVAFTGLNSEIGIRGNRALGAFISQSQTLGPILNAAFSGIALLGFIQLASTAGDKISKLIDDTFIFTKAEQEFYAALVKQNGEIARAYDEHKKALRDISLIGLDQTAAAALKAQYAKQDSADAKSALATATAQWKVETAKLDVMQKQEEERQKSARPVGGKGFVGSGASVAEDPLAVHIREQQALVDQLASQVGNLQSTVRATGDTLAADAKKFSVDAEQQFEKDLEAAKREGVQAANEAKRLEEQRLHDWEKTLAQRGIEYKTELEEEHRLLEQDLAFNRSADEEVAKGKIDLAELQKRLLREVTEENNRQVREQEALLKQQEKPFEDMFKAIERANQKFIDSVLTGTQSIGGAFKKLAGQMIETMVNAFVRMLEEQIAYNLTSGAIGKAHALAGITRDAYKAASNVYAEVPFPFNIPAAAGVFAAVIAMGGALPSAAGGWDVGNMVPSSGGLALIHPQEMVLPAHLADNIRAGGTGNDVHLHVHAIDATSVREFFRNNQGEVVRAMKSAAREFRL